MLPMPSICPLTGSAAIGLANGPAALAAVQAHGLMLLGVGIIVSLTPLIIGTLFAHRVLHMNPVIVCGALAGAMTVDAAVSGSCEVAQNQRPVLGVAVPYAIANVVLTVLGPAGPQRDADEQICHRLRKTGSALELLIFQA